MRKATYGKSPGLPGVQANVTRSSERRFQLLLDELACAEAMAGLANIARDLEDFRRTYTHARHSYEEAVSQLRQLNVPLERAEEILGRFDRLRKWLETVGPTSQADGARK